MCTAATYQTKHFFFGRTLDYEFSYGDEITVTPRRYPLYFRHTGVAKSHYAIIGMAHIAENYPLYYDAMNEQGLCIAGLNFIGNAVYNELLPEKNNVAQFELIPWVLGRCATVEEVKALLQNSNLVTTPFSESLPVAQLHWLIADRHACITVESVKSGLKIYENPVGVLTNNPPFPAQMFRLNDYLSLSPKPPQNRFSAELPLHPYSRGMGALGLPGDLSSQSRFVRAAFTKMNSVSEASEKESISQFFHILGAVNLQRGCCDVGNGKYAITLYTACCDADSGIYYYTTYDNHQISAVDMHNENLDGENLVRYAPIHGEQIHWQN